jgi:hypothetical protein
VTTPGCEITGFSVFNTNINKSVPLESKLDSFGENFGRILLDQYPGGRINIVANVNSPSTCGQPKCVILSFTPGWSRYLFLARTSIEKKNPFTLYPESSPQTQYFGYLTLQGSAFTSSDCSGNPYSTASQQVQTVPRTRVTYQLKQTIAVYIGTNNSLGTARNALSVVKSTCNFIRDAIRNGFLYTMQGETEDGSISLVDFKCWRDSIPATPGPLQIAYRIIPTLEMSPNATFNGFGNRNFPTSSDIWTAIISYFLDTSVRTSAAGEELMSTRVKREIEPTSPHQSFTEISPTVTPFSQAIQTKQFVTTYNSTGGVLVTSNATADVVNSTCNFIRNAFPEYWNSASIVVSSVDCRMVSTSNNAGPFRVTYRVVPTLLVGPLLSPNDFYPLTSMEKEDMEIYIESLFRDRIGISSPAADDPDNVLFMSTTVKNEIGQSNPYFSYSNIVVKV